MTIIQPDGTEKEIDDNSNVARAYRALDHAAMQMGKNGYRAHMASKFAKRPFTPSQAQTELIEAMPLLLAGAITAEQAMSMLHTYDTMKERFA